MPRSPEHATSGSRLRSRSTPACAAWAFPSRARAAVAPSDVAALDLRLVISHLACAEEAGQPDEPGAAGPLRTAAATPAAGAGEPRQFVRHLSRPRLSLRAVPSRRRAVRRATRPPGGRIRCAPVVRLGAPILQVRDVAAPGSVGYGATFRTARRHADCDHAGRICRWLSAGARAIARPRVIAGSELPLAGRVSMDLISLDVSTLPTDAVRPGTMVQMIGGPTASTRRPRLRARSATRS